MIVGLIIGIIIVGFLSGLVVNYLADVLPFTRRLAKPICYHCHTEQTIKEFLDLRRCHNCQSPRSLRFWMVMVFYIIYAILFYYFPSSRLNYGVGLILIVYFGVVAVIDIEHRVVLDQVSLAGAALGFAIGFWLHGLLPTLFGGISGFGITFILYYLGIYYSRWIAHRRGIDEDEITALGFGDVNISGVLGLLLGFPGILAGLLYAIIIAGMFSLVYIVSVIVHRRWQPFLAIPYAPFLVLGAGVLLYLR
jgi:leader peptidase (prepilin peptidase) / N-methyltransferase